MARRTLIVGASGGIGSALAKACEEDGDPVATLSRSADGLDVTDEASIEMCVSKLEGPFQRVFIATGVLAFGDRAPEKKLGHVTAEEQARLFAVNAAGPLLLIKHLAALLPRDEAVHIGVLSARVGSIGDNGIGGWYSYRASKAALNQNLKTAAIELARSHKQSVIAAFQPGTVETPFTEGYQDHHETVTPQTAARGLIEVLDALKPEQSGSFWDARGEPVEW